jgi:hypothetical protein
MKLRLTRDRFTSVSFRPSATFLGEEIQRKHCGATLSVCPAGFLPVSGGASVVDSNGDPVVSGIAITESTIATDGWFAAVEDTGGATGRVLVVNVECAKPSSVDLPASQAAAAR